MRALLLATLLVLGCTGGAGSNNESNAETTLNDMGYTDVTITGTAWFGCGEDDSVLTSRHFRAQQYNGAEWRTVEGTLCCGLIFKGCVVRQ